MRYQRGFSLLEVLLVTGIMGIVAVVFTSLLNAQQKSLRVIEQKQDLLALRGSLAQVMSLPGVCSWQLSGRVFNASAITGSALGSAPWALNQIYLGDTAASPKLISRGETIGATAASPRVRAIEFHNIARVGPDSYRGELTVAMEPDSLAMPVKEISVPILVGTDPASPLGAKEIVRCGMDATKCASLDPARPWIKKILVCKVAHASGGCSAGATYLYYLSYAESPALHGVVYRGGSGEDDPNQPTIRFHPGTGALLPINPSVPILSCLDCAQPGANLKSLATNAANADGC